MSFELVCCANSEAGPDRLLLGSPNVMQVDLNDADTRLRLHLALHVRLALTA